MKQRSLEAAGEPTAVLASRNVPAAKFSRRDLLYFSREPGLEGYSARVELMFHGHVRVFGCREELAEQPVLAGARLDIGFAGDRPVVRAIFTRVRVARVV